MRVRTDLFQVGASTPNGNGRIFTKECLEKMVADLNSGKSTLKGTKLHRAWLEDGKLMAEFEAAGESCSICSKRSASCRKVDE